MFIFLSSSKNKDSTRLIKKFKNNSLLSLVHSRIQVIVLKMFKKCYITDNHN